MVDKVDPFVKVTMFYDEQHEDVGRTATVSASTDPNFATGGADGTVRSAAMPQPPGLGDPGATQNPSKNGVENKC